jgi:hypothetical protein
MRPAFIIAAAAGFAALPILSASAWAQANRTFVSGHGADTNPCTLPAPCRSFAQALSQTNTGGEITVLDPAGYGTVTITKAVSIVNDGVGEAGVTVTSFVDGIDISIGASDVVNLRGLTLVGGGVGANGIVFNNLDALNIQNCVIRGFIEDAIALQPNGSAAFNISDTTVANVAGNPVAIVAGGNGTVTGVFNRVQAIAGGNGFLINGIGATGAIDVTIANSTASNNSTGVFVESAAARSITQVTVVNSVLSNNGTGVIDNGTNSTTFLGKTTIAGNTTAFAFGGGSGALFSFGDNYIKSNGSDGGAIPLVSTK